MNPVPLVDPETMSLVTTMVIAGALGVATGSLLAEAIKANRQSPE
jgi:hypothetical protein